MNTREQLKRIADIVTSEPYLTAYKNVVKLLEENHSFPSSWTTPEIRQHVATQKVSKEVGDLLNDNLYDRHIQSATYPAPNSAFYTI